MTESSIYSICVFSFLSVEHPQDLVSQHLKEISTKKEHNAKRKKQINKTVGGTLQAEKIAPSVYMPLGNTIATLNSYGNIFLVFSLYTRHILNYMLSPSVTGHGLHRLGLKSIEVKLKSNEAKPSRTST